MVSLGIGMVRDAVPLMSAPVALNSWRNDVHFLLECPGYKDIRRQCTSIVATAAAVNSGQNLQQCMGALFTQQIFAELAIYIRSANRNTNHTSYISR